MSSPAEPQAPDAVEAPSPAEGGPQPKGLVYTTGRKPIVEVRIGGHWRIGVVRERFDYPGGTAYQVLLDPGTGHHVVRTYWWSPGMRTLLTPPK